jgi:hypothetical protein
MGKKVYVKCKLMWAKVRPEDRDMGPQDGSDLAKNIEAKQGIYVANLVIDDEAKEKMIKDGVPNKGLQAQLFKVDSDGNQYYKATRPHFNPKLVNRETGEQGVLMGPPKVLRLEGEEYVDWDLNGEDGLLGNLTGATVKLDVWDGKITTMEKILVTDHVPYEDSQDDGGF